MRSSKLLIRQNLREVVQSCTAPDDLFKVDEARPQEALACKGCIVSQPGG
jgi:hypothetical protein